MKYPLLFALALSGSMTALAGIQFDKPDAAWRADADFSKAAVFVAMQRARSATSSRVQPARIRVPPVASPPTRVCTTNHPWAPVTGSVQATSCSGGRSKGSLRV